MIWNPKSRQLILVQQLSSLNQEGKPFRSWFTILTDRAGCSANYFRVVCVKLFCNWWRSTMNSKRFSLRRLDGVNCWWQSRTLEASAVEPPAWKINKDQLSILSSELNGLFVPAHYGRPGARLLAAITSDFEWASLVCELAGLLQHLTSGFNGARCATTDHSAQIIALECEDFEFATNCLHAAAGVISELHCGQGAKMAEEYDRLLALADEVFPELISGPIVEAAKRRGIPAIKLEFLTGFQLGQGIYRRRFCTSNGLTTECTSVIGTFLANDKNVSKSVFAYVNAPYPAGQSVATEDGSVAAANKLGWPVVVKPLDLQCGIGVTANLSNADEVREAFHNARTHTEADEVKSSAASRAAYSSFASPRFAIWDTL